jgi:uncharacterized repeat protein (TIGR03803 family)
MKIWVMNNKLDELTKRIAESFGRRAAEKSFKPGVRLLLPGLMIGLSLILAARVTAQTFTTLHRFNGVSDGANPYAGLILSGNALFGTSYSGGSSGWGTVFKVNTDGTGFMAIYSFTGASDGANPYAGLVLSGNTLYGTAYGGGASSNGTVFSVNTDGTGFTTLHSFTGGSDGANPYAALVLSGNSLYGTAYGGGRSDHGTVFKVNTDGNGFTTIYAFTGGSDGAYPQGRLVLSANTLYGTAAGGGLGRGGGTVFKVCTDGTAFSVIHSFSGPYGDVPRAGLILAGNTLYGTTAGSYRIASSVFKVNTDGTAFTNMVSDWSGRHDGLILSGNTLYGTGGLGGSSSDGTVFAINTDGTGFAIVHSFAGGPSDGAYPFAGLILSGNTLYGTASGGGSSGRGTVFSLSLPQAQLTRSFSPKLTIIPSGANATILTWPANYAGYALQSTTNPVSAAAWTTVSPRPVVVNGQNVVTNPISGTLQFYRLSQ